MAELKISSAVSSNLTSAVQDITVPLVNTDAATGTEETEYLNTNWSEYFGYYKNIPEVKTAIDMRAIWTIGKGYKTFDNRTKAILDHISGFGTDTFNSILKNMIVTRRIAGDAFAEIIRDEDGLLLNLKPLDPSTIKIVADKKGRLLRYEQISKNDKQAVVKFKPDEIFHLTNKRVADEMHGVSDIEAIKEIIRANYENFKDVTQLMHRHVKPIIAFKLDTDDTTKINAFMAKMDAVVNKGENIYIPKDTVEFELVTVPSSSTLSPFQWREHLKSYFYQVVGIPQIILGSASEFSESSAKIAYLAFQQSVEDEQLDIEEQIKKQLYLIVELDFPASMKNELISDEQKDGQASQVNFQPSDMTAKMGRE